MHRDASCVPRRRAVRQEVFEIPSRQFRHVAVVTAATLIIAACSAETPTPTSASARAAAGGAAAASLSEGAARPASAPATHPATANYEIRFMQDMIDHHHMVVMMSEMCLEEAVRAELRTLCSNIIATQTAEIEQMESWLCQWYGRCH